ncbi:MAG: hypothetical protein WCG05_02660 [Alphaproteobacteria bacterium]
MATSFLTLTKKFDKIIHAVTLAGGKFIFVGGCVRDILLGIEPKDYDAEIYGLDPEKLQQVLESLDKVNVVGKSFGVFKMTHYPIDISLPRLDQKTGVGHKGFSVKIDYSLSFKQAARRRDLTINSMGYDPQNHKVLDPYEGQKDLEKKILKATDPKTFAEDPLRALRVAQFASRLQMKPDPSLITLCRTLNVNELPAERILEELKKLLLKGKTPSTGMEFLHECGIIYQLFYELFDLSSEDWELTLKNLDRAVLTPPSKESFALMLAVLLGCVPLVKAKTFLNRLGCPVQMTKKILALLKEFHHLKDQNFFYKKKSEYLWAGYHLKNADLTWKDLVWLLKCQHPLLKHLHKLTEAVLSSGAIHVQNLTPLVQGDKLIELGLKPGKHFKEILHKALVLQFEEGEKDVRKILSRVLE